MLDVLILVTIAGLATARITALIVHDTILDGPRHRLFQWSPPPDDLIAGRVYQQLTGKDVGFFGSLVACDRCTSVWVASGISAMWFVSPGPTAIVAAVAAIAEVSILATKAGD